MGRFLRLLVVLAVIAYVVGRFTPNFHRQLNYATSRTMLRQFDFCRYYKGSGTKYEA